MTILEADRRHVGGRVRTLRFEGGLQGEAGAMRVPTRHEVTRKYQREFGVPLSMFVYSNPQAAIVAPEGRIHFAGEPASLNHSWMQCSRESGLRASRRSHC